MIGSDPYDFVVYTALRSVLLKRIKLALNKGRKWVITRSLYKENSQQLPQFKS